MIDVKTTAATPTALATVLAPISWGTTYVTITELLPDGRPLLVAWLRVAPAGLVLVGLGLLVSRWRPHGREWGRTAALAVCNFGLFFPLLFVAVYRLPGGVAAAVGGVQPLLVLALTRLLGGDRPRARELVVGVAAALGVGLVVVRPGADIDPVGVLAALGANVSFSMGVVLTKRFPAPPNRLAATGWQLLVGAVLLTPVALVVEGRPPALTGGNLAGVAYLSLVGTALAYVLWFRGIRRLPSAAPPLLGLAAPVTGAVVGWAVLGEDLSPLQLLGFALTLAAISHGATLGSRDDGDMEIPPLPDTTILMVEVGSTAHGTGIPGGEDHDELAVVVESPAEVLGLEPSGMRTVMQRTQPDGVPSGPGDIDRTLHSLRRFCRLAATGNPSILMALWAPVEATTAEGDELRALGEAFVGRHVVPRYRGYMRSQAERLLGLRGGGGREHLVAAHGYDTKYAMHCARLGYQCLELLDTGRLVFPIGGAHADWLRAVRRGDVPFVDWWERVLSLDDALDRRGDDEAIRPAADRSRIDAWMVDVHRRVWEHGVTSAGMRAEAGRAEAGRG